MPSRTTQLAEPSGICLGLEREIAHRVAVSSGGDPSEGLTRVESPTVSDLATRFLTEYLPGKKRPPRASTVSFYETLFRCHITPVLGGKHVGAITVSDVERLHSAMRSKPYVANRTLSLLQHAFHQAESWGWRKRHTNPATHIDRYPEERRGAKKEVMLSQAQMATLLEAIDQDEQAYGSSTACSAIRVAFWTGWRIGEVLSLAWSNLNLNQGVAKLLKTKTASEEYRQLPQEAVRILEALPRVAAVRMSLPDEISQAP